MGVWFPSTWLAHSTIAVLVSAAVASCSGMAQGSVLLITLPNISGEDQPTSLPAIWPWIQPDFEDTDDAPRPAVGLAPQVSHADAAGRGNLAPHSATQVGRPWNGWAALAAAEPGSSGSVLSAIGAALTQLDLDVAKPELPAQRPAVHESLAAFFSENIVRGLMHPAGGWDNVTASVSRWRAQGSELWAEGINRDLWHRLLRASFEAHHLAHAKDTSREPAAAVEATPLDAAPPVAASAQLPVAATGVRLTMLTRPWIRQLAGALNQAGSSLQSLAARLEDTPADSSAEDSPADLDVVPIQDENSNDLSRDPAAVEFFEF